MAGGLGVRQGRGGGATGEAQALNGCQCAVGGEVEECAAGEKHRACG